MSYAAKVDFAGPDAAEIRTTRRRAILASAIGNFFELFGTATAHGRATILAFAGKFALHLIPAAGLDPAVHVFPCLPSKVRRRGCPDQVRTRDFEGRDHVRAPGS